MIVCSTVLPERSPALARRDTDLASFGCDNRSTQPPFTETARHVPPLSYDTSTDVIRFLVWATPAWFCTATGTWNTRPAGAVPAVSSFGVYRITEIGNAVALVVRSDLNVHATDTLVLNGDVPRAASVVSL